MPARLTRLLACTALGLGGLLNGLASAEAAPTCQTLYAGKSINAGSLCVDNDADYLTVTYTTTGDWWIDDAHLFVGTSLSQMPQTSVGNPKIGNFPYRVEDLDSQKYEILIPLGDFKPYSCGTVLTLARDTCRLGVAMTRHFGDKVRITDVPRELPEDLVAQLGRQREQEGPHAVRRQGDHHADQPHGDVVETLDRLVEAPDRRGGNQCDPHADHQGEERNSEE